MKTRAYMTRHMRTDLLDRVRVLAAVTKLPMEHIVNEALARGLTAVEQDVRARQQ